MWVAGEQVKNSVNGAGIMDTWIVMAVARRNVLVSIYNIITVKMDSLNYSGAIVEHATVRL
jgi:hypothetical protein